MDNWENQVTEKKESNKELLVWINRIFSNWYYLVLSGIIGVALAFFYLRYKAPTYNINARVLISDEKKGGNLLGQNSMLSDLSGLFGGKSSVDNEAEILKTRFLMEQVVRSLNANITYYHKGTIRSAEEYVAPFQVVVLALNDSIKPKIVQLNPAGDSGFELIIENKKKKLNYGQPFLLENIGKVEILKTPGVKFLYDEYQFSITSIDAKVAEYMDRLTVGVANKQVTVIDLGFLYPLPRKGEDILNTLIDKYTENNLKDKNTIADSTISFIDGRLKFVGSELGAVESDIQGFKQTNKIADISEQSKILLQTSSKQVDELAKTETQLSILSSIEAYFSQNRNNKRVLPVSVMPDDEVFAGLAQKYNALLLERDRLLLSVTETNPTVLNLDEQISNLRQDIENNLGTTKRVLSVAKRNLQKELGVYDSQIRTVPGKERIFLDLSRQQQIKQELYIYLLQKREETGISKTANISTSRVIDPPKADNLPVSPKGTIILPLGLLLGLLFPVVVMYMRDMFNTRIATKEDILQRTSIPIVGEIGNNESIESVVVTKDSRTAISEQFRALRTNLSFFLKNEGCKTVLLTSSMSGEGKSFVALNLATVLAISGKKVIIMEMDLRKPNVSLKLGLDNDYGFTNYIISPEIKPEDVVKPSLINDNLSIISSGPVPPNPAEMILDKRMGEMMEVLKKKYDYIIIDAPPIGLVADAQLLSVYADSTLYVIRQMYTYKTQLNIAEEIRRRKQMNQIALLINDIKHQNGTYGYGGYGYGGYGYGGYGYGTYGLDETKQKKSFFSKFFK